MTATADYFFLLSEYEVFGSTTYANSNEASKQAQYSYYSAGNSKVKKVNGSAYYWWERSPYSGYTYNFCCVYNTGAATVSNNNAIYSRGFAPGFCV